MRGSLGHHRWFCNQFSPFFPVLHCPLGLAERQACPCPDVVFSPLPLSALSSSPNGFGQTRWTGDMTIPLQSASLYDRQVFMLSNCLLDLRTDFNMYLDNTKCEAFLHCRPICVCHICHMHVFWCKLHVTYIMKPVCHLNNVMSPAHCSPSLTCDAAITFYSLFSVSVLYSPCYTLHDISAS